MKEKEFNFINYLNKGRLSFSDKVYNQILIKISEEIELEKEHKTLCSLLLQKKCVCKTMRFIMLLFLKNK